MPQLNPSPWLLVMVATWMILLTIIMPKILKITTTNTPTLTHQDLKNTTWHWPWY
nr:ATPase subunit 8 [Teratoscincus microlepis]